MKILLKNVGMEANSQLPIKITLAILIIMHLLTGVVSKVKCYIKMNKKCLMNICVLQVNPKGQSSVW